MKKVLLMIALLFSGVVFAQSVCDFDTPCDIPFDTADAMSHPDYMVADPPPECPIDNPDCPLPEEYKPMPDAGKALYFLCASVNPYFKRIGIAFSPNHYLSALWSYQRCRMASGPFAMFCLRPRCMPLPF